MLILLNLLNLHLFGHLNTLRALMIVTDAIFYLPSNTPWFSDERAWNKP